MKIHVFKLIILLSLVFAGKERAFAQVSQLTVPNYTACPCQTITANATWNNVSSISYTLLAPAPTGPQISTGNSFPIFNCSPVVANIVYTLVGVGIFSAAPISQTITFQLAINPPAALTLTNVGNYCPGDVATITAPTGGISYSLTGSIPGQLVSSSNIMTIPNLQSPSNNGSYTVTSVIAGCTVTGQTNINVAPNSQIAINTTSNVCQGVQTVNLTANIANGNSYQWFDNFNNPIANTQNHLIGPLIPSQAGVYKVDALYTFNGISCPQTATTQVNVVQTNPVAVSASPSGTVCQGANISLSANANLNVSISYAWSGPAFNANIANPAISPALPSNSGNYTVVATFNNPFVVCTTSAIINIAVVAVSAPVITMPSNVCEGPTNGFTASAVAASNPYAYEWIGPYFQPGTFSYPAVPVTAVPFSSPIPSHSGTYFIKAKFSIGATQCISTSSVQLNVVPVNTVSVIPPGQVCSPDNAFLQALATGANLYTWAGPNGFYSPGANVYVYYPTPTANGIYTVTAYFGSGSNLVCTNTNTLQLTVYPVLNFSLVPLQKTCFNEPVTLSGPVGASSYSWTSSTGLTAYTKDVVFPSAQPNNSGTYTLNISLGPCKSGASTEVEVLTPIEFSLTPFDTRICSGQTITLECGATGGSGNYAYAWSPSIYLESPTGPKQTAVPLGSVVYNIVAHDIACPNYLRSHAFNVKVDQAPRPNFDYLQRSEGCEPFVMFLNSGTQKEANFVTYDFGGNNIFQRESKKDSADYLLPGPGTYTMKVFAAGKNGCVGSYQLPFPIVVYPKPGTDVSWLPEVPTTVDDITFYPSSKIPVTHYKWSFTGGSIPGDTSKTVRDPASDTSNVQNPQRIYPQYGTYPVVLISQTEQGCLDTVLKAVKVNDELQLYIPNTFTPNDDGINDMFLPKGIGMKTENFSMDIFNRAGLVVFSTKDINEGWDGKVRGQVVKDAVYVYKIKVVGMNGEGRKEIKGYVTVLK